MNRRKVIAFVAAAAAAGGLALAAPAAQAEPSIQICGELDVNGEHYGLGTLTGDESDCVVLPPADGGGAPELPTLP